MPSSVCIGGIDMRKHNWSLTLLIDCCGAGAAAEEKAEPEMVEVEWPYNALDTVDAGTFYRDVARAGIQYGPHFRMVEKRHKDGKAVVLRCAHSCTPFCPSCLRQTVPLFLHALGWPLHPIG
jgi:hypothetical protein